MHFRKPHLGIHTDRSNGTSYSGQRFIYRAYSWAPWIHCNNSTLESVTKFGH